MRTAFLATFISLWLAIAVYVAILVLLSIFRRGRHALVPHTTMPAPRLRSGA